MPRTNRQLNLPPAPLQTLSRKPESRKKFSPDAADADSAVIFDEALSASGLTSKEVGLLAGVSESLVSRWRSPNYSEAPSFTQMLRLPIAFHLALHKAMNRRFGFGRAAVEQLLEAAGLLAVAVEP